MRGQGEVNEGSESLMEIILLLFCLYLHQKCSYPGALYVIWESKEGGTWLGARTREGEREGGREGGRARGRESEREGGREGGRARGREGVTVREGRRIQEARRGREGRREWGERAGPQEAVGWRQEKTESENSRDGRRESRRDGRQAGTVGSGNEEPVVTTC
jgi:hypothetical protein